MCAKVIIRKSVELYGEEYREGSTIPYLFWESHGVKNELFFAKLAKVGNEELYIRPQFDNDVILENTPHIEDKAGLVYNISLSDIKENDAMKRFEYRLLDGYYNIENCGVVYAKNPQEAIERLKDTVLSNVSYVDLFYNGLSCPLVSSIYLFPEAYNELNLKDERFENIEFLQNIADKISGFVNINNEFVIDNGHPFWAFDYGFTYMGNCNGNGLSFFIANQLEYEEWSISTTDVDKFVDEVSKALQRILSRNNEYVELDRG